MPAYSGSRQLLTYDYRVIAVDPTALLTFAYLDLLEVALGSFDCVLIPHSTLEWLFEERQRIAFHQPSKTRDASRIRDLLATGALKDFRSIARVDTDLAAEIGENLASLIAESSDNDSGDDIQRVIVRPWPVHRVGSLMDEEADLSAYYHHLCSCSSVVNKLMQMGQLTAAEEKRARSYLHLHEREWPEQPDIADGAKLYLDDIAVTYLQHLGLLEKLRPAGLEAYVSKSTTHEIDALLRYEQFSEQATTVIEKVRIFLASSIQSGKVKLGQMQNSEEEEGLRQRSHPRWSLFDLAKDAEVIIVDDRSLNRFLHFQPGQIPILTTLDVLHQIYSKGTITLDQMLDCQTKLRRAGYIFIPVTTVEIEHYLSSATTANSQVVETAELRAIRENLLALRMSHFLQLPEEASWLAGVMQTFSDALKSQWRPENDDATSRAKSDWLLALLDPRGWTHSLHDEPIKGTALFWYGNEIFSLLGAPPGLTSEVRQRYFMWLDERVLTRLGEESPDLFKWIIDKTKELIAQVADSDLARS